MARKLPYKKISNLTSDNTETNFQQYYPTYKFKDKQVVLIEFRNALDIATSQSKLYAQLTSLLVGVISVLFILVFKSGGNHFYDEFINSYPFIISITSVLFGLFVLVYFMELQKTIILNMKKVVTLRRMLGLDYGRLQLTLPARRLEGASDPFAIKLFPGWLNIVSIPFWILLISINLAWFILMKEAMYSKWYIGNLVILIIYTYVFRTRLNDLHETTFLHLVKALAKIIGVRLKDNFEYVIYRAKLAHFENIRLKFNFIILKKILISIEDKEFYNHCGINMRSLIRAIISQFAIFRKKWHLMRSGASTITMQLARTLFVVDYHKVLRRKIIEILLGLWLEKVFSKEEMLNYYLASVRFDKGIYGIASASKYFFETVRKKDFTEEEALFLVERLSNMSSTYSQNRVDFLAKTLKDEGVAHINRTKIFRLYNHFAKNNKIMLL